MKQSTFETWKKHNTFLEIDSTNTVLTCSLCIKWKSKLASSSNAFITGSKNLKLSAVVEHAKSKTHAQSLRLEEQEKARAENRKVSVNIAPPSQDSPIVQALNRFGEEERNAVKRLFDIAYFIAYKGRPYSDFKDIIELEKMHKVVFLDSNAYENDMGCKLFIHYAAKSLYEKSIKNKVKRANFIAVLVDGATDVAIIEKEVIYILYVDPDNFKPSLAFLSLESVQSQDAKGIRNAIINAFDKCDILENLSRMVFFESDGTAVNSGLRAGVIALLQEKYGQYIKFFWCISHRLELAMKDALKNDMLEVDVAMRDLYYIYHNSGKRLRELRSLFEILKDVYCFESGEVKPCKSTGTRWIDHKLRAMKVFIDKRGLYLAHVQNVISDTTKQNDKATLEGKRRRLAKGTVLLKCAMYADILEPARQLSLITQKTNNINIIEQVEAVDNTLRKYKVMQNKLEAVAERPATDVLPTVKRVLNDIELEEVSVDGEEKQCLYQGVHVTHLEHSKDHINNLICPNVKQIYKCLASRYGSLIDAEENSSKETKDADEIAHAAAKTLNTCVWLNDESGTGKNLTIQLEAISKIFNTFKDVEPLKSTNLETIKEQYIMLVQFTTTYFDVGTCEPLDLWPRLREIKREEAAELWGLIELCLCCPYGNSVCESFISYLRVVKTDWRNRLNESNLTDLLRIKVTGPTISEFNENFLDKALELWSAEKLRRPNQRKRKQYVPRKSGSTKKTRGMERNDFLTDWLADIGCSLSEEDESGSDGEAEHSM